MVAINAKLRRRLTKLEHLLSIVVEQRKQLSQQQQQQQQQQPDDDFEKAHVA